MEDERDKRREVGQLDGLMSMMRMRLMSAVVVCCCLATVTSSSPVPKAWPEQFHSVLVMNYSGIIDLIDLWYDWPKGRNFNIIRHQLDDDVVYDLEWNNGTSFLYTRDSCSTAHLPVGILPPTWLEGAVYLGQRHVDGFLCDVWEKVEFVWYYEDVDTRRPVHWEFYTGRRAHVMTFDVGAVLADPHWQAPPYCFQPPGTTANVPHHHHHRFSALLLKSI